MRRVLGRDEGDGGQLGLTNVVRGLARKRADCERRRYKGGDAARASSQFGEETP